MSKERLEEIKQDVKMTRKDLAVSPSNEMTLNMGILLNTMDWLIEQAELNETYRKQITEMNKTISEQRKQIKGKTDNINKKQRYINFLKYGRYDR